MHSIIGWSRHVGSRKNGSEMVRKARRDGRWEYVSPDTSVSMPLSTPEQRRLTRTGMIDEDEYVVELRRLFVRGHATKWSVSDFFFASAPCTGFLERIEYRHVPHQKAYLVARRDGVKYAFYEDDIF